LAFVPGNSIDGRTEVEWGWANHCVPADDLIASVEGLADRIALTPPVVLQMKKLSINRAAEAGGFRDAINGVAETNALLHFAPDVAKIRQMIAEVGLKAAIAHFQVPPTTPLVPYKHPIK
jgi:enoyl-CoA hydratase